MLLYDVVYLLCSSSRAAAQKDGGLPAEDWTAGQHQGNKTSKRAQNDRF